MEVIFPMRRNERAQRLPRRHAAGVTPRNERAAKIFWVTSFVIARNRATGAVTKQSRSCQLTLLLQTSRISGLAAFGDWPAARFGNQFS